MMSCDIRLLDSADGSVEDDGLSTRTWHGTTTKID